MCGSAPIFNHDAPLVQGGHRAIVTHCVYDPRKRLGNRHDTIASAARRHRYHNDVPFSNARKTRIPILPTGNCRAAAKAAGRSSVERADTRCPKHIPAAGLICTGGRRGAGGSRVPLQCLWTMQARSLNHAAAPGMKSLGGLTPRSLAILRTRGRQRQGMVLADHLYTASRSTFRRLSFESQLAISVPPPSLAMNSPCDMVRKIRIFFGFVKGPFSDQLTH